MLQLYSKKVKLKSYTSNQIMIQAHINRDQINPSFCCNKKVWILYGWLTEKLPLVRADTDG